MMLPGPRLRHSPAFFYSSALRSRHPGHTETHTHTHTHSSTRSSGGTRLLHSPLFSLLLSLSLCLSLSLFLSPSPFLSLPSFPSFLLPSEFFRLVSGGSRGRNSLLTHKYF